MSRSRGRFLVVEGLDGAGTTTQARLLAHALRDSGRRVHLTFEPSSGPVGALVRQVLGLRIAGAAGGPFHPDALALLFAADRLDHVAGEVEPRLARGIDVVTDRYTLSSLAYQSLTAGSVGWIEALNARAPAPDLTLFLRVRPAVAVARRQAETGGGELFEVPAFQRRVARSYLRCIARLRRAGQRVEVIDGERPVAAVTEALLAAVGRIR